MPFTTLNSHQIQLNTKHVRTLSDTNQPQAQMGHIEQDMIAGFENCTQKLIKLLDGSGNDDAINRITKFNFTTAEKILLNSFSPTSLKVELPKIYADLHKLVNLATDDKLALTARQLAIVQLSSGLDVCLGGIGLNIETAIMKVNGLKGLSQKFVETLSTYIEACILETLPPLPRDLTGNEIHRATLVYNMVAPNFGLPTKVDTFTYTEPQHLVQLWTTQVNEKINLDTVIKNLASDFLIEVKSSYIEKHPAIDLQSIDDTQIIELYATYKDEIQPKLAAKYFNLDVDKIFRTSYADESNYAIVDSSDFEHTIAKELANLDLIEPFRPAKLFSFSNEGYKYRIKLIGGSIFYVNRSNINSPEQKETLPIERFANEYFENAEIILEKIKEKSKRTPAVKLTEERLTSAVDSARSIHFENKLASALKAEDTQTIRACIQAGFGLDSQAVYIYAIKGDHYDIQAAMLRKMPHTIYSYNPEGHTPIMAAMCLGLNSEVITYLTADANFNIEEKDNLGMTPIMHAAKLGRVADVNLLIRLKANLNAQDNSGATAFFHALAAKKINIATLLKLKGADPDIVKHNGITPYFEIKSFDIDDYSIGILLLNDLNKAMRKNLPPLMHETLNGRIDRMQILLENNADIDIPLANGTTSLMVAAQKGDLAAISLLVSQGAALNKRTLQGGNALTYAIVAKNLDCVKYLLAAGIDTSAADFGKKQSALSTALSQNSQEIIDYIRNYEAQRK